MVHLTLENYAKAIQMVKAVNKLIYKYYNDGDVFDTTHHLKESGNDLSDYANWLYYHTTDKAEEILKRIAVCYADDDYEDLLKELADELLNEEYLAKQAKIEKHKTIYNCNGKFKYEEYYEEEY